MATYQYGVYVIPQRSDRWGISKEITRHCDGVKVFPQKTPRPVGTTLNGHLLLWGLCDPPEKRPLGGIKGNYYALLLGLSVPPKDTTAGGYHPKWPLIGMGFMRSPGEATAGGIK